MIDLKERKRQAAAVNMRKVDRVQAYLEAYTRQVVVAFKENKEFPVLKITEVLRGDDV